MNGEDHTCIYVYIFDIHVTKESLELRLDANNLFKSTIYARNEVYVFICQKYVNRKLFTYIGRKKFAYILHLRAPKDTGVNRNVFQKIFESEDMNRMTAIYKQLLSFR